MSDYMSNLIFCVKRQIDNDYSEITKIEVFDENDLEIVKRIYLNSGWEETEGKFFDNAIAVENTLRICKEKP